MKSAPAARQPKTAAARASSAAPKASAGCSRSTRVDAYIKGAAPFAQPILIRLRDIVHQALPEVEEAIKWSMPFFVYRGLNIANMAAFKQHCSFGLWGKDGPANLRADGVYDREAMGQLGRLTSTADLPSARDLLRYIRAAAAEIDSGARTQNYVRPKSAAPKPPPAVPAELATALAANAAAAQHFAAMAPGCQREYCDWIAEAKRPETSAKRVATAVEWIAEGKRRNWKYEC